MIFFLSLEVGIGLIFYGTAEPISHYAVSSPTGATGTDQAFKDAMRYTFFHWGIHIWLRLTGKAVSGSMAGQFSTGHGGLPGRRLSESSSLVYQKTEQSVSLSFTYWQCCDCSRKYRSCGNFSILKVLSYYLFS